MIIVVTSFVVTFYKMLLAHLQKNKRIFFFRESSSALFLCGCGESSHRSLTASATPAAYLEFGLGGASDTSSDFSKTVSDKRKLVTRPASGYAADLGSY